jgi:hypothetical protein
MARSQKEDEYHAKIWSNGEQMDLLTGYLEISPQFWGEIRFGTHLRYYDKTGKFYSGGFVLKNRMGKEKQSEKMTIILRNGFDVKLPGYKQWTVSADTTSKIFIKADAGIMMMMMNLESITRDLNRNVRKISEFTKELAARVNKIENR